MTTSKPTPQEAFVWVWLPQAGRPVVAGKLTQRADQLFFTYGRSYLQRPDAMALYLPELPLQTGTITLLPGLNMPACIRDAAPDAWGRRVVMHRLLGNSVANASAADLSELAYLLQSGSNRIGALVLQTTADHYVEREDKHSSLKALQTAADHVERGLPLAPALAQALLHGTSIGGARPKVMLHDAGRQRIAKFSSSADVYSVVKAEFVAMRLAQRVGLDVAAVEWTQVLGRDVLLVERFDRVQNGSHWSRRAMVSALTMMGLDEMMVAHASYAQLAEIVRLRFVAPLDSLRELFARMVFNVLCGNTDDHARNHAAFWDGARLRLTPAYDICPQARSGEQASQGMRILGNARASQLSLCLQAAPHFLLNDAQARAIINTQVTTIRRDFDAVCQEAQLSDIERRYLWGRQFLNPFALYGWGDNLV